MKEIVQRAYKHIILIQDGARYHTSSAIMAFFQKYKKHLTVFQLPSYSPDTIQLNFYGRK